MLSKTGNSSFLTKVTLKNPGHFLLLLWVTNQISKDKSVKKMLDSGVETKDFGLTTKCALHKVYLLTQHFSKSPSCAVESEIQLSTECL